MSKAQVHQKRRTERDARRAFRKKVMEAEEVSQLGCVDLGNM